METRPYFLAGDTFSNAFTGALTGWACATVIPAGWSMPAAMALGMILGMTLSIPLSVLLGIFFGAMEVMIPVMLTAMAAGMAVAMEASRAAMEGSTASVHGAAIGMLCLIATYAANAALTRSRLP